MWCKNIIIPDSLGESEMKFGCDPYHSDLLAILTNGQEFGDGDVSGDLESLISYAGKLYKDYQEKESVLNKSQ